MFVHLCNLLFSVLVIRNISTQDVSVITFYTSALSISAVLFFSLGATVNQKVAFITAKNGESESVHFYWSIFNKSMLLALISAVLWVCGSLMLQDFFKLPTIWAIIAFTPIIIAGTYNYMLQGFFRGIFRFGLVGLLILIDGFFRLIYGLLFLKVGLNSYVYLSIPLSICTSSLVAYALSRRSELYTKISKQVHHYRFPRTFFMAAVLSVFTTNAFISLDVLLSKHFLSPTQAGIYGYLSIVGNMIYFFGSLLSGFIISLVSRDAGRQKNTAKNFYMILTGTSILTLSGYLGVIFFGPLLFPIVFGNKILLIYPLMMKYGFATSLFAIANVFVAYHLSKKEYIFTFVSIFFAIVMILFIGLSHTSAESIVNSVFITSCTYVAILTLLHIFKFKNSPIISSE